MFNFSIISFVKTWLGDNYQDVTLMEFQLVHSSSRKKDINARSHPGGICILAENCILKGISQVKIVIHLFYRLSLIINFLSFIFTQLQFTFHRNTLVEIMIYNQYTQLCFLILRNTVNKEIQLFKMTSMLTPTLNQILFYLTRIPIVLMVMTFIINMIVHC